MALIVALGDSTTAGTPGFRSPLEAPPDGEGDPTSQYAYWLERTHRDWRVLNRGVNGERSDQIRARFERDVLEVPADVVIIIAGVNDIYQGLPAERVKEHLGWMYARAHQAAIPIVAGSILPYNTATPDQNARMRAVNDWIRETATRDARMVFVDTRAAVADGSDPDRLSASLDDLHPSAESYKRMAEALEPAIDKILRQ